MLRGHPAPSQGRCRVSRREGLVDQLVGLNAVALSGGTGASIMLLPVLVFTDGPKRAVPTMAIAALMWNVAKMAACWREIDWRAFAAYSLTGVLG
jgi:hypothetical protein